MRHAVTICCATLALVLTASGGTYVVTPDGTGDFPTIQAALGAAEDGDVIELSDGTFAGDGNRDIDFQGKAVTVRSQSGDPGTCIIECGGSETDPHRGFIFQTDEGPDAVVEGITIMHGWVEVYGGGIFCVDSASPTVTRCVLYKNESAYGGGMCGGAFSTITGCSFIENEAVRGGGLGRASSTILEDCAFVGNSGTYGGGIYIRSSCSPSLTGCLFEGNTASHSGGGLHIELHCYPVLTDCTLAGNSAPIGAAIDISIECDPRLVNCTLWGNACTYTGVISCYEFCSLTIVNSIISSSQEGWAVFCSDSKALLTCCDVYGNAGGDWIDGIAGQCGIDGNISEDPLFCLDENPDEPYTLHTDSPCAPENNPECGQIGAWGVACAVTPVEATSWGSIKAIFR
jgi:hypothetical protein